jgi:fatty-acyl-CoA synthase
METPLSPLALCARGFDLYGDRPAVVDDGLRLTYAELRDRVERLAGGLRALGVAAGDRVALLAPNVAEAFVCYLGVPLAGAILVPLNTRLGADDLGYVLDHAGARLLIVGDELLARVAPLVRERPHLLPVVVGQAPPGALAWAELLAAGTPVPFDGEAADERAVITLNYTSGTTARPKGVMQTHRNACLNAVNMILAMRLAAEDVHLHVAPMFHANGWGMVWATLAMGAANVMLPKVDPCDVLRRVRVHGVTTLCAAATVLTLVLEAADGPCRPGAVRVAVAGMAPPAGVIRRVEAELGWSVRHLYGLTETTAFITYCEEPAALAAAPPDARAAFKARQGVPLPLAGRVRVVRPDMTDVARDGRELGEVVARGNVVMAGYYRDPEATAAATAGGWFRTGDLAVWHPDGAIEIRDRAKDVIISGGENISSLEVEAVLYQHPGVAQAAVVAAPHPLWGETPVAVVVPRQGANPTPEELIAFCRARLPHFKAPTRALLVAELPRTASGKVQKNRLRELVRDLAAGGWR